jgi:hypothetical protein
MTIALAFYFFLFFHQERKNEPKEEKRGCDRISFIHSLAMFVISVIAFLPSRGRERRGHHHHHLS